MNKPFEEAIDMERRKRRGRKDWVRILGEQERSGLTAADFCRREDIGVTSFYQWKRKLTDGSDDAFPQADETFIDMGRVDGSGTTALTGAGRLLVTLDLGGGARLTVQRV